MEVCAALPHDEFVQWDQESCTAIDTALNEADVLGVRLEPSGAWCELLLHVLALPASGPIDPDARRVLRLIRPAQVGILLREDRPAPAGYGPVIPLAGLDAVEEFFATLSWSGSMYGWKFLDDPSLTRDWPARPSLAIGIRPQAGTHSLYWFNEYGREEGEANGAYCIEGIMTFEDLDVRRADGSLQPLNELAADADRYWRALHSGDQRLSIDAQRAAQDRTPSWRPYVRNSVTISGSARPRQTD